MAKAPVVEDAEFKRAVKKAGEVGLAPLRDVALLYVCYGTGLMPIEIAKLTVGDYLTPNGQVREESEVRLEVAFNGLPRPLYWSNQGVRDAVDDYLAERKRLGFGVGEEAICRGLRQDSPLFLTVDGAPFSFTRRLTKVGNESFSCESLTGLIRRLHTQSGIQSGSALSARRTFAVKLSRAGYDLRLIQSILGVQSLTAVRKMVGGDTVSLGSIVAKALQ